MSQRPAQHRAFSNLLAITLAASAGMAPAMAAADNTEATSIVIYRGEVGVIEQQRAFDLGAGNQRIHFDSLPPDLAPGSVRIRADEAEVRAQRLSHRPATATALLEAHVDSAVRLRRAGDRRSETVTVVSADPPLVRGSDGIERVEPRDLIFPEVPEGLGPDGRLAIDVVAEEAGERDVALAYTLPGLSWSVDYDAVVDVAADTMELEARATIRNPHAVAWDNARVGLVAGELALPDVPRQGRDRALARTMATEAATQPEAMGDYHLYRLTDPIDLAAHDRVTVPLFRREGDEVERHYAVDAGPAGRPGPRGQGATDGWQTAPVHARLSWRNSGGPMPAGTVRVYRRDAAGDERLVGGDAVRDIPEDERVRLVPGSPFDITAQRRITEFQRRDDEVHESAHEVRVRNARNSDVAVRIEAHPQGDWEMVEADADWERLAADLIAWTITVPAEGTRTLGYRIRTRR